LCKFLEMKKIITSLVFLVLILSSCESGVKFNNPSIEALRGQELWTAQTYSAIKTSGGLTIKGNKGNETIILQMTSASPQIFNLGANSSVYAIFDNRNEGNVNNYNTGVTGSGSGQIIINENSGGTISGTFNFTAPNTDPLLTNPDKVNFRKGTFYKIPVSNQ
jgi:Family of unknown function (DUF6252)